MLNNTNLQGQIYHKLLDSRRVLIISHRRPDADTLGAALALDEFLRNEGKQTYLACYSQIDEQFNFLNGVDRFKQKIDTSIDYDLVIFVDCGAKKLTYYEKDYPQYFSDDFFKINIDHHVSNDCFADLNWVDNTYASTTLMLYYFFRDFDVSISPDAATSLLAGIYGDTGSFMHSNTTEKELNAASKLMKYGADLSKITKNLFNRKNISALKLWGEVLESAEVNENNVLMSVIRDDVFKKTDTIVRDLSGVVDYLNMVPGTKMSVLLTEDGKGNVKGSFRTRSEKLDLTKVAAKFGGGGHPKASGFLVPGKLSGNKEYAIELNGETVKKIDF